MNGSSLRAPRAGSTGMLRRAFVALAIAAAALVSTGVGTASAVYTDCPSGQNCFWSGSNYNGTRWGYANVRPNLSTAGIATQSGYNRGTSGARACGYQYANFVNMNYSRASGDTEAYSARAIRSMQWSFAGTCPS